MNTLYKYLSDFIFKNVLVTRFSNSSNHKMYSDMVKEIEKMVMEEEGHRIFNQQHDGKLDIDGKLDSQDFNLEIKELNRSVQLEEMTTVNNIILPPKVRRSNRSGNRNVQQQFKNQTVLPKEIIKNGFLSTSEPYIFFGYDASIGKYRYVCYNKNPFSKIPVFRRLEHNGDISHELTLKEIKAIGIPTLLQLVCFLNQKSLNRKNGTQYMKRLQRYLLHDVGVEVPQNRYC